MIRRPATAPDFNRFSPAPKVPPCTHTACAWNDERKRTGCFSVLSSDETDPAHKAEFFEAIGMCPGHAEALLSREPQATIYLPRTDLALLASRQDTIEHFLYLAVSRYGMDEEQAKTALYLATTGYEAD